MNITGARPAHGQVIILIILQSTLHLQHLLLEKVVGVGWGQLPSEDVGAPGQTRVDPLFG